MWWGLKHYPFHDRVALELAFAVLEVAPQRRAGFLYEVYACRRLLQLLYLMGLGEDGSLLGIVRCSPIFPTLFYRADAEWAKTQTWEIIYETEDDPEADEWEDEQWPEDEPMDGEWV